MSDNGKPGKVYVGGIGGDVTRDELDREYSKFGRYVALKGALRSDFTPLFYLLILIYRMKK